MDKLLHAIRQFLADRFNLHDDKAEEPVIIETIKKNVDFKGVNLWALIFAILIASIGLNVNSTAVIIGAMLISPIMGPVMGIGLGIGIYDLELVKKGVRNLLVASVFGIITSTLYFIISPLHEAQSELLARTSPSIWDVFIAFFGGLAGMVAASRKQRSNVIPGVAIATALIPPLCTAGFGIATGNWYFVFGALYLYFINSVFIAIATYLMARYLEMHKKSLDTAYLAKRVNRYVFLLVLITLLPSIFLAYRIVDKSIFETNARKFVGAEFRFRNTQVVTKTYNYSRKNKSIELLLIGEDLSKSTIDSLKRSLGKYQLNGVTLQIRQGLIAKQQIDLSQIKASILEDVYNDQLKADCVGVQKVQTILPDTTVFAEIKILYPAIEQFGLNDMIVHNEISHSTDSLKIAFARFTLQLWLRARYHSPSLKLVKD
jgi:uncharacterized hydrophobic protein (TIGR00271 family)